ncbi:DUF421 domain-containing protein [Xylanibacillus composti]|uniref:DUF421 domain-containing protein n=1 Tax=Xylanibacillus composti TaxID=1572762 RepID=A0A8J4H5P6_9BACL|nr:DUF421 domain-containing protein [Xylanibacillus composti]GIQ70135.1 DUF421 domain-containing protein [Xylanibacillus composti]
MEWSAILFRTVLIYFVLFLVLRLMGKREIGKLSVFDLVISITIAEMAAIVVENPNNEMVKGLLPIATLVSIQIIISWITLKSRKLRLLFDGRPSYLIRNGKLDRQEMRKQRYNLDDLMLQLRERNVTNVADVEFAILETSGKLNVVQKSEFPKTGSANGKIRYEGLPVPLIMDGKVRDDNLEAIGKTRFWLKNELQRYEVRDFKDVFLCTIDHKGKLFVNKMDKSQK